MFTNLPPQSFDMDSLNSAVLNAKLARIVKPPETYVTALPFKTLCSTLCTSAPKIASWNYNPSTPTPELIRNATYAGYINQKHTITNEHCSNIGIELRIKTNETMGDSITLQFVKMCRNNTICSSSFLVLFRMYTQTCFQWILYYWQKRNGKSLNWKGLEEPQAIATRNVSLHIVFSFEWHLFSIVVAWPSTVRYDSLFWLLDNAAI